MATTDQIMDIAVVGLAVGVAAKSYELFGKSIKKNKNIKNIWR